MGLARSDFSVWQGLGWPIIVFIELEEGRCKLAGSMGLRLDVG